MLWPRDDTKKGEELYGRKWTEGGGGEGIYLMEENLSLHLSHTFYLSLLIPKGFFWFFICRRQIRGFLGRLAKNDLFSC